MPDGVFSGSPCAMKATSDSGVGYPRLGARRGQGKVKSSLGLQRCLQHRGKPERASENGNDRMNKHLSPPGEHGLVLQTGPDCPLLKEALPNFTRLPP